MSCPPISVVVCCYTLDRWHDLAAAVGSLRIQSRRPLEVVLVVDNNAALSPRASRELPGVRVVDSTGERGLSAARNTGVAAARGEIVAFLDDDAVAAVDWLERLAAPYADEMVVAVGGRVVARWDTVRPRWMPPTFDWVVGCTYEGHPVTATEVRNPIGANMSVRRSVLERLGGFRVGIGREGAGVAGCEETELCIRMRAADAGRTGVVRAGRHRLASSARNARDVEVLPVSLCGGGPVEGTSGAVGRSCRRVGERARLRATRPAEGDGGRRVGDVRW